MRALGVGTEQAKVLDVLPEDAARQLFDFAEKTYPEYFRGASGRQPEVYLPYLYRYYADSKTYLGTKNGQVYVMGGTFGDLPVHVGALTDFFSPTNPRATMTANGGDLQFAAQSDVTVFWDCNQNWRLDAGEFRAVSDVDGKYTLSQPASHDCILRAKTSPTSSNAGSRFHNSSYTMSALPGHSTSISPYSSLAVLAGLTLNELEHQFQLPEGAIELGAYTTGNLRLQVNRIAIAIADQLQQRDAQIQAGDVLRAGQEIVRFTRSLIAGEVAAVRQPTSEMRALSIQRPLADAQPFFDTSGLPSPRLSTLDGLQAETSSSTTAGWAIRPGTPMTAAQTEALTRIVAALRDARVPVSAAGAINWTMLDTNTLWSLSAAANAAPLLPVGNPQRDLLSAGWRAASDALNARVDELNREANFAAFWHPREGTFEFVTGTAIHMIQGALSAAQLASGARFDSAELVVGPLLGGTSLGTDYWREVYLLLKKLKSLDMPIDALACAHDLEFFYSPEASGSENAVEGASAVMECLKSVSDSKSIKVIGTVIATGAEGKLKGFEALNLISSAMDIASELTSGRARSFLELAKSFLDSYIDGVDYATASGLIADERSLVIAEYKKTEQGRIDRNFAISNLELSARSRITYLLPNQVNVPMTWQLVAPAQTTEVKFSFGTPTPLVNNPASIRSVLEFGDGKSMDVSGNLFGIHHVYSSAGTYLARLSVTAAGSVTTVQRYTVVVEPLKPLDLQNAAPRISAFGVQPMLQGQPIGVDVLIDDSDDSNLRTVRVFIGYQFDIDECVISRGPLRTGLVVTAGCPGLDLQPGRKLYFRVEARDERGADAQPFRREVSVPMPSPEPGVSRPPVFEFIGQPQLTAEGGLTVEARARDPEGRPLTLAAYVSGASGTVATSTRQVRTGVASASAIVFSWSRQQVDSAAQPGQEVQVLVEARDEAGMSAQSFSPSVRRVATEPPSLPVSVTALEASQQQGGGAIQGSMVVSGSAVPLVRVHAGSSRTETRCWVDLPTGPGRKVFSFNGTWPSLAGNSCSSLLPAPGSTSLIVFKVEARDLTGALANDNEPPFVEVVYRSAGAPVPAPTVSGHSPSSATLNQATTFTYSGANLVAGMGFTVTNCDTVTDLGGSATARSFSCIPRLTGTQTLTIKTAPGGTTLYNGTVNVR